LPLRQGAVVDDVALAVAVAQGCADVVEVALVEEALLGAVVGAHGGRQGCVGVGKAVLLAVDVVDVVLVGMQLVVGVGVGVGVVVGCAGLVVALCDGAGAELELVGGVVFGVGPDAVAAGTPLWWEAGVPVTGFACFVAGVEVADTPALGVEGVRSEGGRALTPWRYASAMEVTMLA
jgi:hypothetical protein